jgi:signal transduction histidine kinase
MLKLSLSLLTSAICALFLLGAVLDLLANTDNPPAPHQLRLYSTLLDTISHDANQQAPSRLPEFIQQQQQLWQLPLQLLARDRLALPPELEQQLSATGGLPLASEDGTSYVKALPAHPAWLLQLQVPSEPGHQPEDLWLTLALYGGLCLIMLLWLAPLTRRLWLLSQTASSFGAGNLQARLPYSRWSYISALELSFNQMAQQIEQLLADNRLLASSLSHDLRTPIACFRFGLEAATEESDPVRKNRFLQRLEQDLDRMEAMVNAFLEYASLDRQHQHWQLSHVDMLQLCQQAIQSCEPLATARHLQIELHAAAAALPHIDGHPHWLYRVLLNLLQNACRYAQQRVQIEVWQQDQQLCLRIRDDGAGIANEDAQRVFLPFVRLETQSSTAPQFGLGLAIVRKVLDWHQAQINLETTAPAGASFVITIPLRQTPGPT